jgi:hypothetical protein
MGWNGGDGWNPLGDVVKRRFSSCLASDDITTCGYRVLIFEKCTTIIIVVLMVTSGLGTSFD